MGDHYKSCELHGKEFPLNLIDTSKHDMAKLYLEQTQTIEGKKVKLALFIGKNESEGMDTCFACTTEKILSILKASGVSFSWKNVTWEKRTYQKKDGSGSYERNEPVIKTVEEITEELKAEKAKASMQVAPQSK